MVVSDEFPQLIQQGFGVLFVHRPCQRAFQQPDQIAGKLFVFEGRRDDGRADDDLSARVFCPFLGLEPLEIDHRSLDAQREEKLDLKERALERGDTKTAHELQIEAVELDRDPLPDIGWKAWGMERRGIQTTAGDLWRDAYGRLEQVREVVSGLRERFAETYARVREVAEHSLNGLAEALRGADFSTLEAAHEQVRERDREAERSIEHERDISRERDDGFSL